MPDSIENLATHVSMDFDGTTDPIAEIKKTIKVATISNPNGPMKSFRILRHAAPWSADTIARSKDKPSPTPSAARPKKNSGAEMPNKIAARLSIVSRQCRAGTGCCIVNGSKMKSAVLLNRCRVGVNHGSTPP
ncbi:hypothetical protein [Thalassospira lohafexi]|uniref:hypothetical protein n=1 Tax=Thalassospira lohafexi TaxID=744227 RepID=UPI0013FDFD82|nr:hypothetical protein [Thalassospira lohafexi]